MDSTNEKHRLLTIGIVLAVLTLVIAFVPEADAKGKSTKSGKGGSAKAFVPKKGKLFAGVSDTGQTSDYKEFQKASGAHPSVMQSFEAWGYVPKEALGRWEQTHTRGMLSLSTGRCWGCSPLISTRSIAQGEDDGYILTLAQALAKRKAPTYIRLFPEMNGFWNGYSAFHGNGEKRDPEHSTANFKKAWQRFVLITRGGKTKSIDKQLKKLDMPKIKGKTKRKLAKPKVAFAWVPQAQGAPNVPGNQPADYFPGYRFVDWVGADIYSKFPSLDGLNSIYKQYRKRPFLIGEWAPWGVDSPGFVNSLFDWVEKHKRTRMAIYYQGFGEGPANEFELSDYPKSRTALRHRLNSNKYAPYTPENEKGKRGKGKRR